MEQSWISILVLLLQLKQSNYKKEKVRGRSESYEGELEQRARQVRANAVVGIDVDYEILGADNGMKMGTIKSSHLFCMS